MNEHQIEHLADGIVRVRLTRRELLRLGLGVAGTAVLAAACGPKPAASPEPTGPVTLRWWHVWGGSRVPLMDKQVEDFDALHPDIKVDHLLISQDGMYEKYLTAIAGGNPPDVIMILSTVLPSFATKNVLLELDSYLERDKIDPKEVWYPAEFEESVFGGRTYALPLSTGGGYFFMFYNQQHVKEAGLDPKGPQNWEELEEYSKALTIKEGDEVKRVGLDLISDQDIGEMFLEFLFLNGGDFISKDQKKLLFNSDQGVETLEWMVGFMDRVFGGYDKVAGFRVAAGSGRKAWYAGQKSMHIEGVWVWSSIDAQSPELAQNFSAWRVPKNAKNPNAKDEHYSGGGWTYAIPRLSEHHDQARELLKYATVGDGNLNFFKGQKRPSPNMKVNEDPYFREVNKDWDTIQWVLLHTRFSPPTPVYPEQRDILNLAVEEAYAHKKSPKEALQEAYDKAQKLLDKYWEQA